MILELPYAENYTFLIPEKMKKKDEMIFVVESLKQLHPGFSEAYIWDYIIIKKDNSKFVKASVITKQFYCESRLKNKRIHFYLEENSKKYELFRNSKFDCLGNRKKINPIYYYIFFFIVIAAVFLIHKTNKTDNSVSVEVIQENKEVDIINPIDCINECFEIIVKNKGKITQFEYSNRNNIKLSISIKGCDPYLLMSELLKSQNINDCHCNNINYENELTYYELEIIFNKDTVIPNNLTEVELISLCQKIKETFNQEQLYISSTSINSQNCQIKVQMHVSLEQLDRVHEIMYENTIVNNLYLIFLSEKQSENNEIQISFDFLQLNQSQNIKNINNLEMISKSFEKKRNTEKTIQKESKKTEVKRNEKMEKIGSVTKDGKNLFYYRDKEGKLFISEIELEK